MIFNGIMGGFDFGAALESFPIVTKVGSNYQVGNSQHLITFTGSYPTFPINTTKADGTGTCTTSTFDSSSSGKNCRIVEGDNVFAIINSTTPKLVVLFIKVGVNWYVVDCGGASANGRAYAPNSETAVYSINGSNEFGTTGYADGELWLPLMIKYSDTLQYVNMTPLTGVYRRSGCSPAANNGDIVTDGTYTYITTVITTNGVICWRYSA